MWINDVPHGDEEVKHSHRVIFVITNVSTIILIVHFIFLTVETRIMYNIQIHHSLHNILTSSVPLCNSIQIYNTNSIIRI